MNKANIINDVLKNEQLKQRICMKIREKQEVKVYQEDGGT